jgi:hypothetical protein
MNFNNLNKAVLIGDLVCLDGVHFIVINVNKDTIPEILTGISVEHSYELNFTIENVA